MAARLLIEGEVPLHVAKLLGARQTIQKPLDMETLLSAVRYELAHQWSFARPTTSTGAHFPM